MENEKVFEKALNNMGKLLESLHSVDSPFEFANRLVRATAKIYNADIATLFRVNPSKVELVLEAGFDQVGRKLPAAASYTLPWYVKEAKDMKHGGLTAWVAVTGESLFIKSDRELISHPAWNGKWDSQLYPKGAKNKFGCLYAVPLIIAKGKDNEKLDPKNAVLGVYKIERRKENKEGIFTDHQLREFDLTAKQLTLVITLYERAMLRILSDAKHAVQGRLADLISELDIVKNMLSHRNTNDNQKVLKIIEGTQDDAINVYSWLKQALATYSNPLDTEKRKTEEFIKDTINSRENQQTVVNLKFEDNFEKIEMNLNVAESWDLHTMLISLINNSIKHSGKPQSTTIKVRLKAIKERGDNIKIIIFEIIDKGCGIKNDIITKAQNMDESSLTEPSGTGLIRSYRIAESRGWELKYLSLKPGTCFRVSVPIK